MGKKHGSDKAAACIEVERENLRDQLVTSVAKAADAANAEFRDVDERLRDASESVAREIRGAGEAVRDAPGKGAQVATNARESAQERAREGVTAMRGHRRELLAIAAGVVSAAMATIAGLIALRPGRASQS